MRSCSALLLALVAVSAAAAAAYDASFYSKVASCVAQEVRKELVNKISNTVGIAQAPIKANVTFYAVSFTPGIGCTLMSIVTEPGYLNPDTGITSPVQYRPGGIIAVSATASRVSTNSYTCAFTAKSAAFKSGQLVKMEKYSRYALGVSDPAALLRLPADLNSLKGKVRCSYMLYGKIGFNYTNGQVCTPPSGPDGFPNCSTAAPYDAPFVAWQFDKDNSPADSSFATASLNVTCKVNTALLARKDTELYSGPNEGCFPSWARVMTPAGPKPMAQLAVGDKVLAVDAATGKAVFDDVYLVPHRDADAKATYLNIHASPVGGQGSSGVLTLSPRHYVPTACGAGQQQVCLKHAAEVAAGDLLWLVEAQQVLLARVEQVTPSVERGLYSPWTLSGSIVVEGVAASTHTAWPYEATLLQLLPRGQALAAQHALAQAHHAVQAPLRALYRAVGRRPLKMLDDVIFGVMEAGKAPDNGVAAAVRAAARAVSSSV